MKRKKTKKKGTAKEILEAKRSETSTCHEKYVDLTILLHGKYIKFHENIRKKNLFKTRKPVREDSDIA